MNYKDLPPGRNVPTDVNAIIEIGKDQGLVKYEYDRKNGIIVVDRLREKALPYPINYGCIPQTLSEDGDPLDILVFCNSTIQTGAVIPARPIGILMMDDEKGHDVKIIAVPADSVTKDYLHLQNIGDLPDAERQKIEHFFRHYKDLDGASGRWSTTAGWKGLDVACEYIEKAIERAKLDATAPKTPPASPATPKKP